MRRTPITSLILSSLILVALFVGARMAGYAQTLDMVPNLAGNNLFNRRETNSILRGKHFSSDDIRQILRPDFKNLLSRESSGLPVFADHIRGVAADAANKKMVWANTRRIVASVAANHSPRDRTVSQFVSKAMGCSVALPFFDMELSITAVRIGSRGPQPARIVVGFLDLGPESNIGRDEIPTHSTLNRAIFSDAEANPEWFSVKRQAAELTSAVRFAISSRSHFKSSKFDLVRDARARQRSGISLKTKPLYHKATVSSAKKSIGNNSVVQTCTLAGQGYLGNCQGTSILFFTQTPQSQIARFDFITYAGNFTAANTARSFLIPSGCSSGGGVTIREVRTNGTTCSYSYTGNLPHSRPCDMCNGVGARFAVRNAADYQSDLSADSIAAAFPDPGAPFSTVTEGAFSLPLPRTLGGVRVYVAEIECGLFYVAPNQVNFHVPSLPPGLHAARITTQDGRTMFGDVLVNENAPGIFTADGTGQGRAASYWINSPGVAYLVMFGTGFQAGNCELRLGNGRRYQAQYCGLAPGFVGLSQMNYAIPAGELWQGQIGATVRVSSFAGFWDSQGVLVAR